MTRSGRAILANVGMLFALVAVTLLAWPAAAEAAHVTERVSVSSAEAEAGAGCDFPSVSTDGRYVAFSSAAADLVTGDTGGYTDIFVRDRLLGTTERVSVSGSEVQANGDSAGASISADGRYVAFYSQATNLVSGDTNGKTDVFVRDRALGTTVRASCSTGGTQGNGDSAMPSISADGRYAAFESTATNLVTGDTNNRRDIFVRDLTGGTTARVSVSSDEIQADDGSMSPSISADGRYVAFRCDATNLVAGDTNGKNDVFVRDRVAGTTERVSVATGGAQADGRSDGASISADGRFVAFESDATNLVPDDTFGYMDVFVHDRLAGTTERVSVSTSEAQADNFSYWAAISANGRYIAFQSVATNLAWEDTNGAWDVFLRDRENGSTTMLSISTDWAQGDGASADPAISADGRCVAFGSAATNLAAGDTNGVTDVFTITDHMLVSPVPPITYVSVRGSDRFDTAIKLSQATFPTALPAGAGLVLAPGETYQEALCGAPLAATFGGPVLLTPGVGLNNAVRDELQRLLPDVVFCIGLSDTVVADVDDALPAADVRTVRGDGGSVYDMSYKVALAMLAKIMDMHGGTAIITIGTNFPDAIGVAPLACSRLWPILLTDQPGDNPLHAKAVAALSALGLSKALKVGTYATLPTDIVGVGNCSGADRYATNRGVADWAKLNAGLTFGHIGVTTGEKFPDALASGPYLAKDHGILLLSPLLGPLPAGIAEVIYTNRADVDRVSFIAMIEPVISLVKGLLP